MSSTSVGRQAEQVAASYLRKRGYKIVDTNWRTPRCEIDIVARYKQCIYMVEVKFRRSTAQGTGLEYITPQKQRQMAFAAQLWLQQNDWQGEVSLAAVEVSGLDMRVTNFVTNI